MNQIIDNSRFTNTNLWVMNAMTIDIALSILVYIIILVVTFYFMQRRIRDANNRDDRDGGVILTEDPKIDLPPGVVLPSQGPTFRKEPEADPVF